MQKLIIINQDGQEEKSNILEKLFTIREEEIEQPLEYRNKFIEQNDLKDVTHDIIIKEIDNISNLDKCKKKKILDMLEKLLENKARIETFDCKMYYMAGINDIVDIILNKVLRILLKMIVLLARGDLLLL